MYLNFMCIKFPVILVYITCMRKRNIISRGYTLAFEIQYRMVKRNIFFNALNIRSNAQMFVVRLYFIFVSRNFSNCFYCRKKNCINFSRGNIICVYYTRINIFFLITHFSVASEHGLLKEQQKYRNNLSIASITMFLHVFNNNVPSKLLCKKSMQFLFQKILCFPRLANYLFIYSFVFHVNR